MRLPKTLVLLPEFQQGNDNSGSDSGSQDNAPTNTQTGDNKDATEKEKAPPGGGFMDMLILFGGMFLLLWFFVMGPERRRRKEHQQRLASLKEKDRIVTQGGIHGTVVSMNSNKETISIRIDDKRGTTMEISRGAVAGIVNPEDKQPEK